MTTIIDYFLTVLPALISFLSVIILSRQYKRFRQTHHLYLLFVFVLFTFTYVFSFFICMKYYSIAAHLFPLRQPFNLLLIPFSSFFGYTLFLGTQMPLKKMFIHSLPAIFVFVGFIPFWFLPQYVQENYLLYELKDDFGNMILHNTGILRKVSVFIIFNTQLVLYNMFIIVKFRKFDQQTEVTLHSHPGAATLSIILVFVTFLLVLIDNAMMLGVPLNVSSRIFFNIVSTIVLVSLFLAVYPKRQSIAKEYVPGADEEELDENQ